MPKGRWVLHLKLEPNQARKNQILDQEIAREVKIREIEETKRAQMEKIDGAIIAQTQSRIDTVSKAIDVLSHAYSNRLLDEANDVINKIESGAADMTRQELEGHFTAILKNIGSQDHGVPEMAGNLKRIVGETFSRQLIELNSPDGFEGDRIFEELGAGAQEHILDAVRKEDRVTHKILLLKGFGLQKEDARELLAKIEPTIKFMTFNLTWDKPEK